MKIHRYTDMYVKEILSYWNRKIHRIVAWKVD